MWDVPGGQAGTDYSTTVLGTLAGFDAVNTAVGTEFGFTLNPAFVTEANSALSEGRPLRLMLTMTGETSGANRFARFASDDNGTLERRPLLSLSYTTATPSVPTTDPGTAPAALRDQAADLTGSASGAVQTLWSVVSGPGTVVFADAANPATTATFSAAGDYLLRLTATNDLGEVSRTLAVSVALNPGIYSDWQEIHWPGEANPDITGPDADPNNDGETNLLEFATGQDPQGNGRAVHSVEMAADAIEFTYQRSRAALQMGYGFTVEFSDTLADPWTSVGAGEIVSDGETQVMKATIPEGSANRRFVRLRVNTP